MAGRKQILYHCTTPENAAKIREQGLLRMNKPWVYLSENPLSWWQYGLVVLPIRITGLKGEMRTFLPESDEIFYFGDIPAGRIYSNDYTIPRRVLQKAYKEYKEKTSELPFYMDENGSFIFNTKSKYWSNV